MCSPSCTPEPQPSPTSTPQQLEAMEPPASNTATLVGGSSKIQTLCHMTQVLLKMRFTTMERLLGY